MSDRFVSGLALVLVGVFGVAGVALYLRGEPRPGAEPSLPPAASGTVAPSDSPAPSESPTASATGAPTDSAAPTESPTASPVLSPSPEVTASPPAGSLEEFLAGIAVPVVMEIDGKAEWVIARPGSITKVAPADEVTFAFVRNGVIVIAQPLREDRSVLRVLAPSGEEVASSDVPLLGPGAYAIVTRDRRLAYVMDSDLTYRVDLRTGKIETLHDLMPGFRGEVSPSGDTFVSVICPEVEDGHAEPDRPCQTQVLRESAIVTVDNFAASAATDAYLVGEDWFATGRRWVVHSIADGTRREVPVPEIDAAWGGYALEDGRFLLTGSDEQGDWSMWVFDPQTDSVSQVVLKDIAPSDIVVYEKFLPSARWAVIKPIGGLAGGTVLYVIDLETGHTVAEVVLGR
jgi:hypothetical protein